MDTGSIIAGILIGGIFLTLWGGLVQNVVPIGIKSVKEPDEASQQAIGNAIADLSTNGMFLLRHKVTALIAVRPYAYYSPGRYLALEALGQFIVATILVVMLTLTAALPQEQRLLIVLLAAGAGAASGDAQNWNWWGFSGRYFVGIVLGRLIGYGILAILLTSFILRPSA